MAPGLPNLSPIDMSEQSQSTPQSYNPIATIVEEAQFVDNYFTHYHPIYPMLHEDTFKSMQDSRPTSPDWLVLSNAVLAFGAWLNSDADKGSSEVYFGKAENCFEKASVESQGSLTLIQASVLLAEFAQKQGVPQKCGRYIGSAVQMAVALGLQMELGDSESTELDKEIRRRVWWSVYCSESCSAKTYGRPLLLPEDALITVKPVSNIQPNQVQEAMEMINDWHKGSSLCLQVTNPSSAPDWYFTVRRRQILCDRSLRLLIHRPLLLRWLKRKSIDGDTSISNNPAEAQCRAQGLELARTTVDMISDSFISGRYSKLTLSFTLYALFHALIVPLIHIKADPSAPTSITCMQDITKAKTALQSLPADLDSLSQSFVIALSQLFSVSFQTVQGCEGEYTALGVKKVIKPHDVQSSVHDIFGNQELDLLKNEDIVSSHDVDFSEWIHS
ncbi:uncharacterized protein N7484_008779 [Penicillium longicatenatum]|uniref:uncharacterized protein n=1 Tax=Penicillium longicatenatum TaxID=1561947 RepID=UPI002547DF80|nr:uncharacterized protein N7484_008779 [Penicillium longicatenatum]KAJ5635466.1 hypothetical protein N7484_008779 [Penicillium longicatenatum]